MVKPCGSGSLASSLGRAMPEQRTDDESLAIREKYWRTDGVLLLMPADLADPFDKQWATNIAERVFQGGKHEPTAKPR